MAAETRDLFRGYRAALPHVRSGLAAYHAAMSGEEPPANLDMAVRLLKHLTLMARTSGGTSGPDKALIDACEEAEAFLGKLPSPSEGDSNAR